MTKNHIKRIKAPRTWRILRKAFRFVTKPNAGAHNQNLSTSINTFLKDMTNTTKTTKETKYLLTKQEVLVNGKRIYDDKFAVGFLDTITIPSIKKHYTVTVDTKAKLVAKEITEKEAQHTLVKVSGKKVLGKDKVQINTLQGRNILVTEKEAKQYKLGDSLDVKVPENKIDNHTSFEKGSTVFIYTGKHAGKTGTLEEIKESTVTVKTGDETFETKTEYAYAVGTKNKITIISETK